MEKQRFTAVSIQKQPGIGLDYPLPIHDNTGMSDLDREEYEAVQILKSIVEADLMGKLLTDEGIPFYVREWHDVNNDGIWMEQKGWGWILGRKADEEKIHAVYRDRIVGSGT